MATIDMAALRDKYEALRLVLDERACRLWAAAEAKSLGRGGAAAVRQATGISGRRIWEGKKELEELEHHPPAQAPRAQRIRRPGGGRKRLSEKDPTLVTDLEALIEPTTRGDPESPLRWTTKSVRHLAEELRAQGHEVSADTVDRLLHQLGYSLQAPRKEEEGGQHPDRDAQFKHISRKTREFQQRGQPVLSVDTKKKELVGNFKNGGQEWWPSGQSPRVNVHDFPDMAEGKAIPYGVYDIGRDEGWVNVGVDHDTPEFSAESIRQWWRTLGRTHYPEATDVLIIADSGGSNSARSRVWKQRLQEWADETGLSVSVCHYPPGTSKWNKIEHQLFSRIAMNWRGHPLTNYETIVGLIGATTTRTGRPVQAALDKGTYPTGVRVNNKEMSQVRLRRGRMHGEWNYTLLPRTSQAVAGGLA